MLPLQRGATKRMLSARVRANLANAIYLSFF